jgi:DNA-binding CsgD family transcriptional regulator
MLEAALRLSDPAVMRALRDIPTMQRWEILRRAKRAMSAAEVSAIAGASIETVHQSLDALVSAKLAVKLPATRRRRHATFRSAMARLVIRWSRSDPSELAASRELGHVMRAYGRRLQDEAAGNPGSGQSPPLDYCGCNSVMLLDDDALRVRESFRAAYALLADADQRARERQEAGKATPYLVSFDLIRLRAPEPRMAEYFVVEEGMHDHERRMLDASASRKLSRRELDIARMLERGMSRPEIANELGISLHTVASASKSVYRKLGVSNRAQLTKRMQLL